MEAFFLVGMGPIRLGCLLSWILRTMTFTPVTWNMAESTWFFRVPRVRLGLWLGSETEERGWAGTMDHCILKNGSVKSEVLSTFWSQGSFMLKKFLRTPKSFCLCKLYLFLFTVLQIKIFLRKVNTRKRNILFAVRVMMSSHIVWPLENSTVPMWEMEIKKRGVGNHDLDLIDSDWVLRTPQAFRPYFGNSCSCFRLFSTERWSKKSQ